MWSGLTTVCMPACERSLESRRLVSLLLEISRWILFFRALFSPNWQRAITVSRLLHSDKTYSLNPEFSVLASCYMYFYFLSRRCWDFSAVQIESFISVESMETCATSFLLFSSSIALDFCCREDSCTKWSLLINFATSNKLDATSLQIIVWEFPRIHSAFWFQFHALDIPLTICTSLMKPFRRKSVAVIKPWQIVSDDLENFCPPSPRRRLTLVERVKSPRRFLPNPLTLHVVFIRRNWFSR